MLQFCGGFSARVWAVTALLDFQIKFILAVDLQGGTWAARAAKWDRDFYIAIFESDLTHRLLLQEMFLPEDEFSRRAAGRHRGKQEPASEREGKKDRKRQDGTFVRLLNTTVQALQNNYSCQTKLFLYSEHYASTYELNNSAWNPADSVVMRSFRAGVLFHSAASVRTGFTKQPGDRWVKRQKSVMCSLTGIRWERGGWGVGRGSKCAHCFMFTMMGTDPMRQCLVWTNHSDETQGQQGIYWP